MATILQSLKLSSVQRERHQSPLVTRRNKLIKSIHEQCKAAEASQQGQRYSVKVTRRIRNRVTGEQADVLKDKQIRECWWVGEDGTYYLELRYGRRLLEIAKGKTTIVVGTADNLIPTLEKLRDAVLIGEFDEQLNVASSSLAQQLQAKRQPIASA